MRSVTSHDLHIGLGCDSLVKWHNTRPEHSRLSEGMMRRSAYGKQEIRSSGSGGEDRGGLARTPKLTSMNAAPVLASVAGRKWKGGVGARAAYPKHAASSPPTYK